MLVDQCSSCGAPASLGCTVCGRTFCRRCLDSEERVCSDCLQNQRRARSPVELRPPPSRSVSRRPRPSDTAR